MSGSRQTTPSPASAADAASIEVFFDDRPAARKTFETIRTFMGSCGAMELASTKSRVAFVAATRFLWVHGAHLDGSVTAAFILPERVDSPRLRSGALGAKWSHHVKVHGLDPELQAWFRAAYHWDRAAIKDATDTSPRHQRSRKAAPRVPASSRARGGRR